MTINFAKYAREAVTLCVGAAPVHNVKEATMRLEGANHVQLALMDTPWMPDRESQNGVVIKIVQLDPTEVSMELIMNVVHVQLVDILASVA